MERSCPPHQVDGRLELICPCCINCGRRVRKLHWNPPTCAANPRFAKGGQNLASTRMGEISRCSKSPLCPAAKAPVNLPPFANAARELRNSEIGRASCRERG